MEQEYKITKEDVLEAERIKIEMEGKKVHKHRKNLAFLNTNARHKIIPIVDPLHYYSVSEILKLELIPNVTKREELYKIMLYRFKDSTGHTGYYPKEETNFRGMRTVSIECPGFWKRKWAVLGEDIIKFSNIHNFYGQPN